ncbi:hypothetical protein [Neorhizobium lilium]|uniref:hypothetical protein n=1 Tax=Neorhizobium lilium TaxID=2503024 RepID=UPI001FE19511|nr:hypothetical protein [Neorhizobium lilium]
MPSRYDGLFAEEADDLTIGIIGLLVAEAMREARAMTKKQWDERDAAYLPHYFACATSMLSRTGSWVHLEKQKATPARAARAAL